MKKLLTSLLLLGAAGTYAQTAFNTCDSININHINAMVLVHGDMWWNPSSPPSTMVAHCYFPNGTTKSLATGGALWMSGYDAANALYESAGTYRQHGVDYWPGPLNDTGGLDYATSQKWNKIWKVNRTDVDNFRNMVVMGTATASTIPPVIWTWPAKGNANAQGAAGAALTITTDMAPFVDANGDGIYQPLLGDYPDFKGEQALWWVFSDNGPTHAETNWTPLRMEVHAMAYAYSRGTLIDNIVYYQYSVQNKSTNTYHDFRIGQMADLDLGDFSDDYMGFDSTRGFGYLYNGHNVDGQYGNSIPMTGLRMMPVRSSAGPFAGVGIGSFIYYNNDLSLIGIPSLVHDYEYYMRSKVRDGSHFTNDYTGPGTPSVAHGSGPDVNYVYTGDLHDANAWTECSANNIPGDRKFVISSGDLTIIPGGTITLTMMLVATNPDTSNACGDTALSLNSIDSIIDLGVSVYEGATPPTAVSNVNLKAALNVYPNPAYSELYIESNSGNIAAADIFLYNTVGQAINATINKSGNHYTVDVSKLPNGIYYVRCKIGDSYSVAKFIKQ